METALTVFAIAIVIGAASGAIGSFVILQRLALVGDALSHVALPGIALALAYGFDPFWGVLSFLIVAAFIVWWLEQRSALPPETLVGILFTASLAVGILTIPDHEIIESLFGAFPTLSLLTLVVILSAATATLFLTFLLAGRFLYTAISPELARVDGIGEKYRLALLLLFALVVALGIKLVGTLLMGALTIIPAAIARNLTRSMRSYIIISTILGALIAAIGAIAAQRLQVFPGPAIIIIGVAFFLASLVIRRYAWYVIPKSGERQTV